jgi:hypothetical protein
VGSNPECHRKASAACRGDAVRTAGAAMPKYDYRFLDLADNVAMVELVERDDDRAASAHAKALLNRPHLPCNRGVVLRTASSPSPEIPPFPAHVVSRGDV